MFEKGLTQLVGQKTSAKNILDLVLTTDPDLHQDILISPFEFSDHHLLQINTCISLTPENDQILSSKRGISKFIFEDHHWNLVNERLSDILPSLLPLFDTKNTDAIYEDFINTIEDICLELEIPTSNPKPFKHNIPPQRRRLFKKRCNILRRLKSSESQHIIHSLQERLSKVDQELQDSLEAEVIRKEIRVVEDIKENVKAFYSFANSKRKTKPRIGPFLVGDEVVKEDDELACTLADHFSSVFSQPLQGPLPDLPADVPTLEEVEVTAKDCLAAINSLNRSSSPGPDGVTVQFLVKCKESVAPFLASLLTKSMQESQLPLLMKIAHITPLFKGGSKSDPTNHRPVSVTSNVAKVWEKIKRRKILAFLQQHDLLPKKQHGFLEHFNTTTQLLEHFDQVLEALESHDTVDIYYLDFAKAYDKCDFRLLLHRLSTLGIRGKVLRWIEAFLTNRVQRVKVNGHLGELHPVLSGVPQGTVLGPLLFILFISPLAHLPTSSTISSYADDTKLVFGRTRSGQGLQDDLEQIYQWVASNNMAFNSSKFRVMTFGNQDHPPHYTDNSGQVITQSHAIKDLGVIVESNGEFKEHVQENTLNASQICGWIMRTFHLRSPTPMMTLFKSLVQPHLDYCSPIWYPKSACQINKVERVQRVFTRQVQGMKHLSYWDRLKRLHIYSQQRRMERYKIIHVFKCLHSFIPTHGQPTFTFNPRTGYHCQIKTLSKTVPKCAKNIAQHSVIFQGPSLYNCLPPFLRQKYCQKDPIAHFKQDLDMFLSSIPDQPTVQGLFRPANSNSLLDQIFYKT